MEFLHHSRYQSTISFIYGVLSGVLKRNTCILTFVASEY